MAAICKIDNLPENEIMDIIQEPGVMAVKVPENATNFQVVQPENIAFSSFQLMFEADGKSQTKNIDSNVEFSNIEIKGRCTHLNNAYLDSWCKKMGITDDSYVILKLSY